MPAAYASEEKRTALVRAAKELLHERGFHRTSLADVAGRARVPLGNVHYYFKTKEALAEAVIAAHESALSELFASWVSREADPRLRLKRLIRAPLGSDEIIQFGCPHGSLCQELEKLAADTPLARAASRLLVVYVGWAETQFRELGYRAREARGLGEELVASLQGSMLLAHTLRSPQLLASRIRRIERWLDAVESKSGPRSRS